MKRFVFFLLFGISDAAKANEPNFDVFCRQLLQENPSISDYSAYFTQKFREAVPLDYMKSIFADVYGEVGKCVSYQSISRSPNHYELTLNGHKRMDAVFSVIFDESLGRFSSLLLSGVQDPSVQIKNWNDVETALSKLDPLGKLSATLSTSDASLELVHNGLETFAIGSTFKLYILGALADAIEKGLHTWDEILPLKEEWKSLPSGVMHKWPAGQPVKLYEFAENMISISDNTAADLAG